MNEYRKEISKASSEVKWTLSQFIFKWWLPLVALLIVMGCVSWVAKIASQPAKIVSKTMDADNVIHNYEWFKQTAEDITATISKIKTSQEQIDSFVSVAGPRTAWTFEDKTEYSRLASVVTGLKNYRDDLAATYNARSKMINRNIFEGDTSLPYFIR